MSALSKLLNGLKDRTRSAREYYLDRRRYTQHAAPEESFPSDLALARAIETQATKDYHRVEKALALAQVKRPFGKSLGDRLDQALLLLDPDTAVAQNARTARFALAQWNDSGVVDSSVSPVGSKTADIDFELLSRLFETRHSVRHFSDTPVPRELLLRAAELAGRTPSVCNRQSWRVYFATAPETTTRLLRHQNGNSGFGRVAAVALVTVDSRLFSGIGERNQGWIDGGLFSMSLVWALHGMGVASCMLNMSVTNRRADALRAEFGIPSHELIIMQIAIGYPAEGHRIARSPRRGLDEIVTYL